MRLIQFNKTACVFALNSGEAWKVCFVFELNRIPHKPTPRQLIFERRTSRRLQRWSMTWREFGKQHAVGNIALIARADMKYSTMAIIKPDLSKRKTKK